jgi:RNA polymerase sigma factor (sigma-70 family)
VALPWQPTDAQLIARVRDGDEHAFEQIYERYGTTILAFCTHLARQREDAEDAVQHSFLAAYRQILGSSDPLELRPWLFTVARNRCLTQMRSHADRALSFDVPSPEVAGLAEQVERREELRQLVVDLGMLPEPQRAALLLSQLDAMPYAEIGQVLGVTPEKVKSLVFQARSSLASTRDARDAPCVDVRQQLATARGASLRRRALRRHVHVCTGCREYETIVRRQRRALDQLLPVPPSAALTGSVLGAIGREGGAGAGGAAIAASGGSAGGSMAGALSALGGSGIAKVAVVAAVVGSSGAGAVAADLPERIAGDRAPEQVESPGPGAEPEPLVADGEIPQDVVGGRPLADSKGGGEDRKGGGSTKEAATPGDDPTSDGSEPESPAGGGGEETADSPSGLVKHGGLPPGQAKKDGDWVPPGQERKQGGTPPGQAMGHGIGGNGNGGGKGAPQGGPGNGQGGNPGNGGGNGNPQGGGQGNGNPGNGGQDNGNPGGGNGTPQGGQGNGGGNGQGQGNPGNGNGGGNGNNGGNGNGNGG